MNCSGYYTIGTSGSELKNIGIGNNCSGSGYSSGLASGHTGAFLLISPGSISCSPAELRARSAPGELTRTIVRLPDRTGHGPAVSARHPAWIKKFILGVDTLYYMGYYGSIVE